MRQTAPPAGAAGEGEASRRPCIFLVERALRPRLSEKALAATQGIISAASELGAAAVFFVAVVSRLTSWELVGFGVGGGVARAR